MLLEYWEVDTCDTKSEVVLVLFDLDDIPVSQLAVLKVCSNRDLYSPFLLHLSKNKPEADPECRTVASLIISFPLIIEANTYAFKIIVFKSFKAINLTFSNTFFILIFHDYF